MTTKARQAGHRGSAPSSDEPRVAQPSDAPTSGVHRAAKKVRRGPGWTVTEQFVREGYRYRLMRRPLEPAEDPRFTRREEEALSLACDGCSNKRIAQIMDVSPSTVGVLLFRAATKLNVKSRHDLVATYKHWVASAAAVHSTADIPGSKRAK